MTHAELDKLWNKLTKKWKERALQFIKDEKFIVESARELGKLRDEQVKKETK